MNTTMAPPSAITQQHEELLPRRPEPESQSTRSDTKGIMVYLLIAFGLAWIFWIPVWLAGLEDTSPLYQGAYWTGAFAPAIGAIVVRRWVMREGFADAGLRPRLRSGWRYYLFAWLWPLPLIGVALGLATAFGFPLLKDVSGEVLPVTFTALCVAPLFLCEELGWRGYLQIRLLGSRPLFAALATGAIWGIWHYPAALAGFIPNEHGLLSMLLIPWWMILFSIILGSLQLRTGSVWAPTLAHSANNFIIPPVGAALLAGSPGLGDLLLSWCGACVFIPMVILCACIVLSGGLKAPTATSVLSVPRPA